MFYTPKDSDDDRNNLFLNEISFETFFILCSDAYASPSASEYTFYRRRCSLGEKKRPSPTRSYLDIRETIIDRLWSKCETLS